MENCVRRNAFNFELPPKLEDELPSEYFVLKAVNLEFHESICSISQQSAIGVAFDGPRISRKGELSWICISTPLCVFLFDIFVLGKYAFDNGLRQIFENGYIEKVIHDCRQPSDCLTHLYETTLVNVFDTQIADYMVNMQMRGDEKVFKNVNSLHFCLENYLHVRSEFFSTREKCTSYEDHFFHVRPISDEYQNVLIINAVYLILLKEKLQDLMFNPFQRAVDAYLNELTNLRESEVVIKCSQDDSIAPECLTDSIQKVEFKDIPMDPPSNPFICPFKDPVTGEVVKHISKQKI